MKKILSACAAVVVLNIVLNSTSFVKSNSSGAPAGNTGAPSANTSTETTCSRSSGCHGPNLNVGPNSVAMTIAGNPASYDPGTSYTITTAIQNPTGTAAGFQTVCLSPAKANIGVFTAGTGSKLLPAGGRSYITHTDRTRRTWTYTWTAPNAATAPDSVIFYVASMEKVSAFNTYTSKFVFYKTINTSAENLLSISGFTLYPVPAAREINLSGGSFSTPSTVEIVSLEGRSILKKNLLPGITSEVIEFPGDMQAGQYILRMRNEKGTSAKRFTKL